jgi:hypothetical protein
MVTSLSVSHKQLHSTHLCSKQTHYAKEYMCDPINGVLFERSVHLFYLSNVLATHDLLYKLGKHSVLIIQYYNERRYCDYTLSLSVYDPKFYSSNGIKETSQTILG